MLFIQSYLIKILIILNNPKEFSCLNILLPPHNLIAQKEFYFNHHQKDKVSTLFKQLDEQCKLAFNRNHILALLCCCLRNIH